MLEAADDLLVEIGFAAVTIEGIAARAGVGKQTIYRWWPSKGAVLLEALDRVAATAAAFPDTGDIVADLRTTFGDIVRFQADPDLGRPLAALIGEAQHDAAIGPLLQERFFRPRRAPIVARLRRAQEAGELPAAADAETLVELLFGALFHRLLLGSGPLDAVYASLVVDVVIEGARSGRTTWPD